MPLPRPFLAASQRYGLVTLSRMNRPVLPPVGTRKVCCGAAGRDWRRDRFATEGRTLGPRNLDGGPSTGLWCRNEAGAVQFEKPGWAVRNAIVVIPRASR